MYSLSIEDLQLAFRALNTAPGEFSPGGEQGQLMKRMAVSLYELGQEQRQRGQGQSTAYWLHRAILLGYLLGSYAADPEQTYARCRTALRGATNFALRSMLSERMPESKAEKAALELAALADELDEEAIINTVRKMLRQQKSLSPRLVQDVRSVILNGGISGDDAWLKDLLEPAKGATK